MEITNARLEGNELILSIKDHSAALRFVYGFKAGLYEIIKAKKKRSLDANAYCWVLLDKLAEAVRYPKEQIYRDAIRNIGGNTETICVKSEAVDKLCEGWRHNGIGWQTETSPSKIAGCTNVILYYGSSTYDTRQMSNLIENIIQECKALDIETMPPDKLAALLKEWEGAC